MFKNYIVFLFIVAVLFSCSSKIDKILKKDQNLNIIGIKHFKNNSIIIISDGWRHPANVYYIVLSKDNKIINNSREKFQSSKNDLIYTDERYWVSLVWKGAFLVFDSRENIFYKIYHNAWYIADFVLFNNDIYFSTEKVSTPINRINIKTKKFTHYKINAENSPFYIFKDRVYVKNYITNVFYFVDNKKEIVKSRINEKYKVSMKLSDFKNKVEINKYKKILNIK